MAGESVFFLGIEIQRRLGESPLALQLGKPAYPPPECPGDRAVTIYSEEEGKRGQTRVLVMTNFRTIAGWRARPETHGGYLCVVAGTFVP